jgi:hypothetical protein
MVARMDKHGCHPGHRGDLDELDGVLAEELSECRAPLARGPGR